MAALTSRSWDGDTSYVSDARRIRGQIASVRSRGLDLRRRLSSPSRTDLAQVRGLIEAAVAEIGEAQHALEQFRSYVQVGGRTEANARLHEFETLHASLKAEASIVEEAAQRYVELEKKLAEDVAPEERAPASGGASGARQPQQFQIFDDEDADDAGSTLDLESGENVHSRLEEELATEYIS